MPVLPVCSVRQTHRWVASALIGELDAEMDAAIDLADIRAAPLNPVVH